MEQNNPLKQYFRQIKIFIKLPSGTSYYPDGAIQFNDAGEVGIMPMTGKDELLLKNPDSLLNGDSIVEIIKSCVPAVKDPKVLLTNDVDALITAVRFATYNDTLETSLTCPKCTHEDVFKLDLEYSINNMTFLEPEYVVNLESGLSVFVKPYGFPEILSTLHAQFEQSKLTRALEGKTVSDEERLKVFSSAFKIFAVTAHKALCNSIIKIVDESKGINVTNKDHIQEFLQNIDKKSIDSISDMIENINSIGIKKTFKAKCSACSHEWDNEIDFNPVNFS